MAKKNWLQDYPQQVAEVKKQTELNELGKYTSQPSNRYNQQDFKPNDVLPPLQFVNHQDELIDPKTGKRTVIPNSPVKRDLKGITSKYLSSSPQSTGEIKTAAPKKSTLSKAAEIVRNPLTAIQSMNDRGYLPENFELGDRNILDNAIDVVNPMTYVDAATRTLSAKHFRDLPKKENGDIDWNMLPDAVVKTLMDASMVTGLGSELKNALKAQEFELVPQHWDQTIESHNSSIEKNPSDVTTSPEYHQKIKEYERLHKKYNLPKKNPLNPQEDNFIEMGIAPYTDEISAYNEKGNELLKNNKLSQDAKDFAKKMKELENEHYDRIRNSPNYDGDYIEPMGFSISLAKNPLARGTTNSLLFTPAIGSGATKQDTTQQFQQTPEPVDTSDNGFIYQYKQPELIDTPQRRIDTSKKLKRFQLQQPIDTPSRYFRDERKPDTVYNWLEGKAGQPDSYQPITKDSFENIGKLPQKQQGGKISTQGYKANSPDRFQPELTIPGGNLTMLNVPHDVMAYPNNGQPVRMKAGVENYTFPGADFVRELPIRQFADGGELPDLSTPEGYAKYKRANLDSAFLYNLNPKLLSDHIAYNQRLTHSDDNTPFVKTKEYNQEVENFIDATSTNSSLKDLQKMGTDDRPLFIKVPGEKASETGRELLQFKKPHDLVPFITKPKRKQTQQPISTIQPPVAQQPTPQPVAEQFMPFQRYDNKGNLLNQGQTNYTPESWDATHKKMGGQLPKAQYGWLNQLKPKPADYHATGPNDPRIQAAKDSSDLYNNYLEVTKGLRDQGYKDMSVNRGTKYGPFATGNYVSPEETAWMEKRWATPAVWEESKKIVRSSPNVSGYRPDGNMFSTDDFIIGTINKSLPRQLFSDGIQPKGIREYEKDYDINTPHYDQFYTGDGTTLFPANQRSWLLQHTSSVDARVVADYSNAKQQQKVVLDTPQKTPVKQFKKPVPQLIIPQPSPIIDTPQQPKQNTYEYFNGSKPITREVYESYKRNVPQKKLGGWLSQYPQMQVGGKAEVTGDWKMSNLPINSGSAPYQYVNPMDVVPQLTPVTNSKLEDANRIYNAQQTGSAQTVHPYNFWDKANEIVRNPMTAIQMKNDRGYVPDNLDKNRNVMDYAADFINPVKWLDWGVDAMNSQSKMQTGKGDVWDAMALIPAYPFKEAKTLDEVKNIYKSSSKIYHPDKGGLTEDMQELNNQYEKKLKELQPKPTNSNSSYNNPFNEPFDQKAADKAMDEHEASMKDFYRRKEEREFRDRQSKEQTTHYDKLDAKTKEYVKNRDQETDAVKRRKIMDDHEAYYQKTTNDFYNEQKRQKKEFYDKYKFGGSVPKLQVGGEIRPAQDNLKQPVVPQQGHVPYDPSHGASFNPSTIYQGQPANYAKSIHDDIQFDNSWNQFQGTMNQLNDHIAQPIMMVEGISALPALGRSIVKNAKNIGEGMEWLGEKAYKKYLGKTAQSLGDATSKRVQSTYHYVPDLGEQIKQQQNVFNAAQQPRNEMMPWLTGDINAKPLTKSEQIWRDIKGSYWKPEESKPEQSLTDLINANLKKGYGIHKGKGKLSVDLMNGTSSDVDIHGFNIFKDGKRTGMVGFEKKDLPGNPNVYSKHIDYPYDMDESLIGSGISGEVSKAMTDALQQSGKGHLYSSQAHSVEGLARWNKLVDKGKAELVHKGKNDSYNVYKLLTPIGIGLGLGAASLSQSEKKQLGGSIKQKNWLQNY